MDISVVLPVVNECGNLRELIPRLWDLLKNLHLESEIIVVDGGSIDGSQQEAIRLMARVVPNGSRNYGSALTMGFSKARGDWVLTLDADMSHQPAFVAKMWRVRDRADIIVASRYARGGVAYAAFTRRALSRVLNVVYGRLLSIPIKDLSSGFRLYRKAALQELEIEGQNFEVLEEILIKAYMQGFIVTEVPFTYFPRTSAHSHERPLRFGWDLARSAFKLWKLRNSLASADYDERAFYSPILIQRYWQRRRHHITTSWARDAVRILDVGCGSSVIIQSLNSAVGMDYSFEKLRFLRRYGIPTLRGSAFALPFKSSTFECLISSQVIEHLPFDEVFFREMRRVLRPGGMLIIGTPDYATLAWRVVEPIYGFLMPGAYKDEHITHYTRQSLTELLGRHGFEVEEAAYVGGGELIMRCRLVAPSPSEECSDFR